MLSPTFISHSYDDEDLPPLVRAKLPPPAELVIFPPVKVAPDETISGRLLERIRACRSLVWIDTENGRGSPWVTLERDYARRAGLEVYRFDGTSHQLGDDRSEPLQLPVFTSYQRQDRHLVNAVVRLMKERYFDVFYDIESLKSGDSWQKEIERGLTSRLQAGGYCVAFWSQHAAESGYVREELKEASAAYPDQILTVRLDDTPLPHPLGPRQSFPILTPEGSVDLRLVDNLIVWIYWMVQRGSEAGRSQTR